MKVIKKIATTLTDTVGKIFNSITDTVDKKSNAPSILYMERYVSNSVLAKYSTEEMMIGTWVNNKPLYRKCYLADGGNYKAAHIELSLPANIDTVINISGVGYLKDNAYARSVYSISKTTGSLQGDLIDTYLRFRDNKIVIRGGDDVELNRICVILEYTKTTD